jgi:hypothetical protein
VSWFSVYSALIDSTGTHGRVKDVLDSEDDPMRSLKVALNEIAMVRPELSRAAIKRVAYWQKKLQSQISKS